MRISNTNKNVINPCIIDSYHSEKCFATYSKYIVDILCFITCSSTASSKGWRIPRVSISYFDVIIPTTFTNFMNIESLEFKLNIMAFRSGDHPDAVCIWRVKAWIPRANQSSIWFDDNTTAPCMKQPDLLACSSNFFRAVSLFFCSLCQDFKW